MGITFEDIQRANQSVKTTDIKGKEYAEVKERIKAFRMVCPDGCIRTEIVSMDDSICVIRAEVSAGDGRLLATGTAFEYKDSSYINKTSYVENCETSAVGRALGMIGFGIDVSVASYEEVQNAITNQDRIKSEEIARKNIDQVKVTALANRCKNEGVSISGLCGLYKVAGLEDLTETKFANINQNWDKIKERCNGDKGNG